MKTHNSAHFLSFNSELRLFLCLIAIFFGVATASCKKESTTNSDMLLGKWQLTHYVTDDNNNGIEDDQRVALAAHLKYSLTFEAAAWLRVYRHNDSVMTAYDNAIYRWAMNGLIINVEDTNTIPVQHQEYELTAKSLNSAELIVRDDNNTEQILHLVPQRGYHNWLVFTKQ